MTKIEQSTIDTDCVPTRRAFIQQAAWSCAAFGALQATAADAAPVSPQPSQAKSIKTPRAAYLPISAKAQSVLDRIDWKSFSGMSHITGFNYQPSWGHNAPTIWLEKFDAKRYRADLELGKKYFPGFNIVRIWLGYGAYKVNPTLLAKNFHEAVNICTEVGLLVLPVLFTVWDGSPPFDPIVIRDLLNIDFDKTFGKYLRDIVVPQTGNKSILAWDLCNEPSEGSILDPSLQAQDNWLKYVHQQVKTIDPQARTCIGTIADFSWGQSMADYCDVLTPHLYGYSIWKVAFESGKIRTNYDTWYECTVDQYVLQTTMLNKNPRPILSSETCWGARDDDERVKIIKGTLTTLKRHGIGFIPHALHTSPVADLHIPANYQAVLGTALFNPATMAFINADGKLRPGHQIFNEFT